MQKETSLLGSVSAGYWKRQMYNSHQDHEVDSEYSYSYEEESALKDKYLYEDEDELEVRFTQLGIKSTFSDTTYPTRRESVPLEQWGELDPDVFGDPTVHRDKKGVMWCDDNSRLYPSKEAEGDSLPVNFCRNRCRKNADESKRSDRAFMLRTRGGASGVQIPPLPTSGRNAYQMEKETSLLGSVSAGYSQRQMGSVSAGFFKRQLYNSYQDHKVNYKYSYSYREEKMEVEVEYGYPVPYEDEGKVGYEYPVLCEAKDDVKYPVPYEDEGKVEFEHLVPYQACEAYEAESREENDYPACNDKGKVEYDYPALAEAYEDEGEALYYHLLTRG